jgi:hypothetical protein
MYWDVQNLDSGVLDLLVNQNRHAFLSCQPSSYYYDIILSLTISLAKSVTTSFDTV